MLRTTLVLSEEMMKFYNEQAEKYGTSRNSIILMAMKAWMDMQRSYEMKNDVVKMIEQMQEMAKASGVEIPQIPFPKSLT